MYTARPGRFGKYATVSLRNRGGAQAARGVVDEIFRGVQVDHLDLGAAVGDGEDERDAQHLDERARVWLRRSGLANLSRLIKDSRTPSGTRKRATRALCDVSLQALDTAAARIARLTRFERDLDHATQEQLAAATLEAASPATLCARSLT
jgi:hypothetical protein